MATGANFLTLTLKLADKNANDTEYRALALEWFNLVIKDISNRQVNFQWRFLEKTATTTTVASQSEYQLPSDIDTTKIIHVYDKTNDRTLVFVPYERFRRFIADESNSSGEPQTIFTIFASELILWPEPSTATTIFLDYVQTITDLADDTSSIEIPAKYDQVIIDGVMTWIFKFDPEMGDSTKQQQIFELGIDRMIKDNNMIIAENEVPISHRLKHFINRDVDRKDSFFFPLAGTNF